MSLALRLVQRDVTRNFVTLVKEQEREKTTPALKPDAVDAQSDMPSEMQAMLQGLVEKAFEMTITDRRTAPAPCHMLISSPSVSSRLTAGPSSDSGFVSNYTSYTTSDRKPASHLLAFNTLGSNSPSSSDDIHGIRVTTPADTMLFSSPTAHHQPFSERINPSHHDQQRGAECGPELGSMSDNVCHYPDNFLTLTEVGDGTPYDDTALDLFSPEQHNEIENIWNRHNQLTGLPEHCQAVDQQSADFMVTAQGESAESWNSLINFDNNI
jgi:hypothetical protein